MIFLFWILILSIFYIYFGYPFILFVWSKLSPNYINKHYLSNMPLVSVVIAVKNEELNIKNRIENIFSQDYQLSQIEIILVSDGSTDSTNHIVRQLKTKYKKSFLPIIKLIELNASMGKPNALNIGISNAKGEFVVFTDTRQQFEPNVIKELLGNFNDPQVGSVSGELLFIDDQESNLVVDMGFYWKLEKRIRKMESAVQSVAGATGAIYAIRKSLYKPIPKETLIDDVLIPMNIIFQGYRNVFDDKAKAYDIISENYIKEKKRKIRTLLGNYQILKIMPKILLPLKNPIFFQFVSHKVLRLLVPFLFIIALLLSLLIGKYYLIFFIMVILTTTVSIFNSFFNHIPFLGRICKITRTFYLLNYFAFLAFFYFIIPSKRKIW